MSGRKWSGCVNMHMKKAVHKAIMSELRARHQIAQQKSSISILHKCLFNIIIFFRKWQGDGDSNLFLHRFLGSFRFVFLQNMIPQEDSINAISDILQNQFLIKVLALVLITVLLVVRDTSHDCNCKYVEGPQKCFVLGCVIPHPGCLQPAAVGVEFTQPRPSLLKGPFTVMTNNARGLWLFFLQLIYVCPI